MTSATMPRPPVLTRRIAISRVGVAAAAIGLGSRVGEAAAQVATPGGLAGHPIVGSWITVSAPPPSTSIFAADGTVIIAWAPNYVDPVLGLTFQAPSMGTWEPVSERGIHFTAVQVLTDAEGTFTGTFTLEGHPLVGEDGQTFTDVTPDARFILRDANNAVLMDQTGAGNVTAVRITPGSLIFPEGTPAAGTPTG